MSQMTLVLGFVGAGHVTYYHVILASKIHSKYNNVCEMILYAITYMSVKLSFELECSIPKRDINVCTFLNYPGITEEKRRKTKRNQRKSGRRGPFLTSQR